MTQEYYWYIAVTISGLALIFSGLSLFLTLKKDSREKSFKLLSLKTEVLVIINALNEEINDLQMLISRQLILFQENPELRNSNYKAHIYLNSMHKEVESYIDHISEFRGKLSGLSPTDYEAWESFKSTYKSWSNSVKNSLEKQKESYTRLRKYSEEMANKSMQPTAKF